MGTEKLFDIQEELKKLPDHPGVYIMHDDRDAIIYIGKAISLRNRVRQYFQTSRNKGPKIEKMVTHIDHFEYILTDSELEALVLECNLIKEHRPKYNTMLKDDKTYPYIKVTLGEAYPQGAVFPSDEKGQIKILWSLHQCRSGERIRIDLVQKLFQIRTCNRTLPRDIGKERPCLNYHIHQCQAPCQGYISKEDYRLQIRSAMELLERKFCTGDQRIWRKRCRRHRRHMEFEKAMEYRDLLTSVRQVAQKQKITSFDGEDRDILALAMDDRDAVVQVFFVREGRLIGREHFHVTIGAEDTKKEVLSTFISQYYAGTPFVPKGDHASDGN